MSNPYRLHPDGTTLVSGANDGNIKLWNVAKGTNIATFKGHTSFITSVSFAPDGKILASGPSGGTVRLWDVATKKNIATLEGHLLDSHSLSFSPDGKILASGSLYGIILLWDMSPYIIPQSPIPDFDGDGTVDFADFLQFVALFGLSQDDEGYEARFDLDGDGMIGFSDFLIFASAFGKKTS